MLIEPDRPSALHYSRNDDAAWTLHEMDSLDGVLSLSAVGVDLQLAEVYEGLAFETL